ncbi:MAG TPA: CHAT domain-containing protein [Acidobacteriota bacterium]|nr:CHAT domain-containing protein [Acidobacteriota bacterium]
MAEEKVREADALMRQAEQLEESFGDSLPKLERRLLLGRLHLHRGEYGEAQACFSSIRAEAQVLLSPERVLTFLGHYLEALGLSEGTADIALLLNLVDQVLRLIPTVLPSLPPPVTRRPLEGTVGALVSTVERHGVDSLTGQELLRKTWSVIVAARSVACDVSRPADSSVGREEEHQLLEKDFYLALSEAVLNRSGGEAWKPALKRLLSFEVRGRETGSEDWAEDAEVPQSGISLAMFSFADLLRKPLLLLVTVAEGRLDMELVPEAEGLAAEWRRCLAAIAQSKDGEEPAALSSGAFAVLLSKRLRRMLAQTPATSKVVRFAPPAGNRPDRAPTSSSLTIYPDDRHRDLPFELMRVFEDGPETMGEAYPLTIALGLRPSATARLRLERGWLGFGGGGRRQEQEPERRTIIEIQRLIKKMGFPARLIDGSFSVQKLSRLLGKPPGVLHLAMPCFAEEGCRQASGLILLDEPPGPEEGLLPYGRICQLDLSGVDLVVLSGAVGTTADPAHSGASSSLAAAFLRAGASQVLTGRLAKTPPNAEHTLLALYRHLAQRPAPEALALARGESIRLYGDRPASSAWCLWC